MTQTIFYDMQDEQKKIAIERNLIKSSSNYVRLFAPCKIGEGIMSISKQQQNEFRKFFLSSNVNFTFFIPASGSGSRMFSFLSDINTNSTSDEIRQVEKFINHLPDFAFYQLFSPELKQKIKTGNIDTDELSLFLLKHEGLNFENLPKGLIPFHYNDPFVLNPFQEHVLQGSNLSDGRANFHFTVQQQYKKKIQQSIANLAGLTGKKYKVSYSTQRQEMDSYAFSTDGELIICDNKPLRRPSGHGALLSNLNSLDSSCVFIKNIDNIQHYSYSGEVVSQWSLLGGILTAFSKELKKILSTIDKNKLVEINEFYQFLSPSELNSIASEDDFERIINRPIRVCGLVKNEGLAGGGPFWVEKNGKISKQIVEKAQIAQDQEQVRLMIKSTHFNPVMIAMSPYNARGQKHNLEDFKDDNEYFIVTKKHGGQTIQYIELPGLWNGSMSNWNTVFVEIPSSVFSPVKNILDLLSPVHFPKK